MNSDEVAGSLLASFSTSLVYCFLLLLRKLIISCLTFQVCYKTVKVLLLRAVNNSMADTVLRESDSITIDSVRSFRLKFLKRSLFSTSAKNRKETKLLILYFYMFG